MVVFGVGCWIKDSNKKEASRLNRDSCRHYNRRSGSCFKYKVICCHICNGWEKKREQREKREKKGNKGKKKKIYRLKINITRYRIIKQEMK